MIIKNIENNSISTAQIGWSLWVAVGSTSGYIISFILFFIARIRGFSVNKEQKFVSINDPPERRDDINRQRTSNGVMTALDRLIRFSSPQTSLRT